MFYLWKEFHSVDMEILKLTWNGMDMDPYYGSIYGFRGIDLNPATEFLGNCSWCFPRADLGGRYFS
jgi:hypothetical protein